MSSVVLSSLRAPVTNKKNGANPLVRDQMELVPNISHVSRPTSISICNTKCTMRQGKESSARCGDDSEWDSQGCGGGQATEGQHPGFHEHRVLAGRYKIYESKRWWRTK